MEGLIKIEGLRIQCVIGAHAYERSIEQELICDVEMRGNLAEPVRTDSVVDTINYTQVCEVCQKLAQERQYHLLETFAYEALHALIDTFPLIDWAKIRVKKRLGVPLARYAVVEFEKKR